MESASPRLFHHNRTFFTRASSVAEISNASEGPKPEDGSATFTHLTTGEQCARRQLLTTRRLRIE